MGRLYVDGDVCGGAETLPQGLLYLVGAGVGDAEGCVAVHADVQFDGVAAADAACAQVVRVLHIGESVDDGKDFALYLFGQGGFHQFVKTLAQQFPCHAQDKECHNQRGQWVENGPTVAQPTILYV